MRNYSYPEKITQILKCIYKETLSAVKVGGDLAECLKTVVGVLQGCVLYDSLFNIFLEVIIITAMMRQEEHGSTV